MYVQNTTNTDALMCTHIHYTPHTHHTHTTHTPQTHTHNTHTQHTHTTHTYHTHHTHIAIHTHTHHIHITHTTHMTASYLEPKAALPRSVTISGNSLEVKDLINAYCAHCHS